MGWKYSAILGFENNADGDKAETLPKQAASVKKKQAIERHKSKAPEFLVGSWVEISAGNANRHHCAVSWRTSGTAGSNPLRSSKQAVRTGGLSGFAEPYQIARRFPLAEARHAHELLGKGGVVGKIVFVCNGSPLESGAA